MGGALQKISVRIDEPAQIKSELDDSFADQLTLFLHEYFEVGWWQQIDEPDVSKNTLTLCFVDKQRKKERELKHTMLYYIPSRNIYVPYSGT